MNAFRTAAAQPVAFVLAIAVTIAMLASVSKISTTEYRQALVTAQAAEAAHQA